MNKKFIWEIWMGDKEKCRKAFNKYLKKGMIKKEEEKKDLSKSHIKKTDYNLNFINHLLEEKRFYDWIIVGCYYTIYQASLSILAIKGYSSKSHIATLCSLVYLYHKNSQEKESLDKADIELVAKSSLEKEEVSYFVEAKSKRETASYGISEEFSKTEAESLRNKTILFVNKVKRILEQN